MGLDQYAHLRGKEPSWGLDDKIQDDFYWRKHARLQVFMSRMYDKQNPKAQEIREKNAESGGLEHLGFNGDDAVTITTEVLDELEKAIKDGYYNYFAHDGFFWGQQYQEEQAKEYKKQDIAFVKWARKKLEKGEEVVYGCSW
jgi:hypothetical protein